MKGHKSNHHEKGRASGGGVNESEEDRKSAPKRYNQSKVEDEADEEADDRKRGGKVKKKAGGEVKCIGGVAGAKEKGRADRAPRKSGGRTGSNMSPLSSAASGEGPKAHKVVDPI